MAYEDPTHLRANPIKVRLNEDEFAAVEALARLNKMQKAVFVRELLLEGLASLSGAEGNHKTRAA